MPRVPTAQERGVTPIITGGFFRAPNVQAGFTQLARGINTVSSVLHEIALKERDEADQIAAIDFKSQVTKMSDTMVRDAKSLLGENATNPPIGAATNEAWGMKVDELLNAKVEELTTI